MSDLYRKGFYLAPGEDIIFPKKETSAPQKRIECEGCGNPDVYNGCKCKYCKRWYGFAKEEPKNDPYYQDTPLWIGGRYSGGYIPITQESERSVAKITGSRTTMLDRIYNKWKRALI